MKKGRPHLVGSLVALGRQLLDFGLVHLGLALQPPLHAPWIQLPVVDPGVGTCAMLGHPLEKKQFHQRLSSSAFWIKMTSIMPFLSLGQATGEFRIPRMGIILRIGDLKILSNPGLGDNEDRRTQIKPSNHARFCCCRPIDD